MWVHMDTENRVFSQQVWCAEYQFQIFICAFGSVEVIEK